MLSMKKIVDEKKLMKPVSDENNDGTSKIFSNIKKGVRKKIENSVLL
jgi:hypothetical protein